MVKPAGKKRIATHLIEQFKLSERSACRLAGIVCGRGGAVCMRADVCVCTLTNV